MKMGYVHIVAHKNTKETAEPIHAALSRIFDKPRTGQMPMNFERTKLSVSIALKSITSIAFIILPPFRSRRRQKH